MEALTLDSQFTVVFLRVKRERLLTTCSALNVMTSLFAHMKQYDNVVCLGKLHFPHLTKKISDDVFYVVLKMK